MIAVLCRMHTKQRRGKGKRLGKGNKDEVKETKTILLHIEYEF